MAENPVADHEPANDPGLIADSLAMLAAFREIRDPTVRQTVMFLVRALRPDPEAVIATRGAGRADPRATRGHGI